MYGLIANILALLSDLLGRITPARADKLDQLDAAVSSRAPASTAVSNAVLTDLRIALLDNLANLTSAPDRLKARNYYTISASGTGAVTAFMNFPAMTAAKYRVTYLGCYAPSAGTCSGGIRVIGTVVIGDGNTASSGMTWSFMIEEYW